MLERTRVLCTHRCLIYARCRRTYSALPAARAALSKDMVDEYYAEESAKVLDPVSKFLAQSGITPTCRAEIGPAGEAIAKIAEEGKFDLIIMGTHGHGSLGKLVMGSVSTQVLANCSVPVMLIR